MKVYAFDVDETLEISGGPVKLQDLMQLRIEGHIVGLCGNWAVLTLRYPGWQHLVSFLNICAPSKEVFLATLRQYTPADDYVMVGNIQGVSGASDDQGAALRTGWRFIKESDFANGAR
jgi:hypothetical protein